MLRQNGNNLCNQADCSPEIQLLFLNNVKGRKVVVWGTGELSGYVSPFIEKYLPISFYTSRDAVGAFRGIRVTTKEASGLSPELHYVVVLANPAFVEIRQDLEDLGFVQYYSYFDLGSMQEWHNPWLSDLGVMSAKPLKYRSCAQIEYAELVFQGPIDKNVKCIQPCCWIGLDPLPAVAFGGTPEDTLKSFMLLRREIIAENIRFSLLGDDISDEERKFTKICTKCPSFIESGWPAQGYRPIAAVHFAMYPSPCQCKCTYCFVRNDEKHGSLQFEESIHSKCYDRLFDTVGYALDNKMISEDVCWQFAAGEITIHPYKEKFLDLIKNQAAGFVTNAFLFDESIAAHLSSNPRSSLCFSIDCGTPETWRKIKGVDNFDAVVANIAKYLQVCQRPEQVQLKYIILPGMNDNSMDYHGIVEILKKLQIARLGITPDHHSCFDNNPSVQDDLCKATGYLAALLRKNGIAPGLGHTQKQLERIEYYANEALAAD